MSQFTFLRSNYLNQPYEVAIETFALCNAACTFCPYPTLERKGTKLSFSVIGRLIAEMSTWQHPFYISPFKVNEPLLDVRLPAICSQISEQIPHAKLRLFTNGSPLTERHLRWIDNLDNVAHLWVSLNSHEPEEYHRLMRLTFETTAKKLDTLHRYVQSGYFRHQVVISKVSATMNEGAFMTYCATRWPFFTPIVIKQDGWLGYVPPMEETIPDTPCMRWFELSILATGVASLCCMDGKGQFPLGNVTDQSLLDIYNAPLWRERREHMVSRRKIYPCNTCTY